MGLPGITSPPIEIQVDTPSPPRLIASESSADIPPDLDTTPIPPGENTSEGSSPPIAPSLLLQKGI